MLSLTSVIIDDESSSRNSLRQKLNANCPEIKIIAECENAEQGIEAIENKFPDIVFLDVEMPRMNGLVMLQQLTNRNFELIFTTAYDHYAIQAIRFCALDYLVKPIEVEDLKTAISRAEQKKQQHTSNERIESLLHNLLIEKNQQQRLAIPSHEGLLFAELSELLYLEAESNYTVIFMTDGRKITVTRTLKDFEELLPPHVFIRIHHSHIINKNHIQKYIRGEGGQVIMKNGTILYISRRKKEEFLKSIGQSG
jgi:two-component system LytT family response regulator